MTDHKNAINTVLRQIMPQFRVGKLCTVWKRFSSLSRGEEGFNLSFSSAFMKIYHFTTLYWVNKHENNILTNFPSPYNKLFLSYWKQVYCLKLHFSGPTSIYLFKFSNNNSRIKCEICSKLAIEAPAVVLGYLLLTLNSFGTLVYFNWIYQVNAGWKTLLP